MEDGGWRMDLMTTDHRLLTPDARTLDFGLWTLDSAYAAYAHSVSMKKNPLSTSLRSEIQATDSTLSGWSAKMAATKALRHMLPVMILSTKNRSTTLRVCKTT